MSEATEPQSSVKARRGDPCTATSDCSKPAIARGWCSMHYARWQRYGDPLYQTRPYAFQGESCTAAEGCDRPVHAFNLCSMHYDRLKASGETTTPRERKFWAQVDKSHGPDACWPWTGFVAPNGYGSFGAHRRDRLAHRIAYGYLIGPIPGGLVLDHLCHTRDPKCADTSECPHRRCVNPRHLEPVTRRENIARGRGGDSWGYVPDLVAVTVPLKAEKPASCAECGRMDKPVYKSGKCRPCYRRWLKDPAVRRPSRRTPEERFWEKVDKTGTCWLWTASINPSTGYGQFSRRHGEPVDAHRFSYALANGPIPNGLDVHHTCHVRHCVNPAHLEAVTRSENLRMRKYRRDSA